MTKKCKTYSARAVAWFFIWKGNKESNPISNKKLQKLLYYAQAWSMVFYDNPIFKEDIEAWVHGPAIRDIYSEYRHYGFSPIRKSIPDIIEKKFDEQAISLMNEVWRLYGERDADYLEVLTHNERPWQEARAGIDKFAISDATISLDTIKSFYKEKLDNARRKS